MNRRSGIEAVLALCASLFAGSIAPNALAATSGDNGSHDPSRMLESEGKVYIYSTGGRGKSSPDGLVWTNVSGSLPWNSALLPNNQGVWAPDGIYLNGQYYLYGSLWSENNKSSAIVLLTSPTLNPASPNYRWTDRGVVVSGPAGVTHSVIDAAPVLDADGNLWMTWGGGYPFPNEANSIFVTRLDNQTGLPLTSDPGYRPPNTPGYPLKQGHKEGPYIHYRNGYYYLFWQTGNCCGTSNPYVMHVDRSASITGPFSGDRTFYASRGNIYGPGHMGIYSACGFERFTYHYYPASGNSVIGENELTWGADGWPVVGAESTTPLRPCGMTGGGGAGGSGGAGGGGSGGAGGTGGSGGIGIGGVGGNGGASGGVGGSGGAIGGAGNGGAGGGGDSGTTGFAGSGGIPATGGTTGVTGGAGVGGGSTGGSAGASSTTGGTLPTTGGAGSGALESTDAEPDEPSGCACHVRARGGSNDARGLWMLGLALVAARRSRRRTGAS